MKNFCALLCGLLFGFGLAVSGMTDTAKVIGFLDFFGQWVPDLIFVMGGAVCVSVVSFYFILKRRQPIFEDAFHVPTQTMINKPLLLGAALFGIGWGIYGYCPGPALAAIIYLQSSTFIFLSAMLVGMMAVHIYKKAANIS